MSRIEPLDPARDPVAALLESSTDAFCALDREQRCIYANRAAERILGVARGELIGRDILPTMPASVADVARRQIRSALEENVTAEFRVPWDSLRQWFDVRICPSELGLAVYFHDVTRQVKAEDAHAATEQALRHSEQRLRQALDAGNCGIYEWDVQADRVTWSDRLYEFFGVTPEQFRGTAEEYASYLHPDDRPAVWASVQRSLAEDVPHRMEYRIVRPDGQVRWIFTNSAVIRDAEGRPQRMLGACIDVTDRKAADEALRQSEDKYRTLTDAVGSLMWMSDGSGQMCFYNRRWDEFLAGDASAILGLGWKQIVHPEDIDAVVRERTAAIAEGRPYSVEYRLRRHDGQYRWHLTRVIPHKDASGQVLNWFGTATDIHDLKTAEAAVLHAKSEAEHANRAKDQFLAVLSHELRTPLTPVVMTIAAMEMDRGLTPQMREDLAMIRRNIELETKLIDDLLDVTRIANGKLRLQPKPSDVHALVRHVLDILRGDIAEKHLHVTTDLSAGDSSVSADPARLQQVFWNLVKNAVKFTSDGGHVTVRTWNPSERSLCLEVSDDGAGIDPEALPRIFNAFDQGEQSVTRQFGGLGLGLAISKALTELHGGTLRVHSDGKGRGARFTVELPTRTPVERIVDKLQSSSAGGDSDAKPRVRVLLVEDHFDTQRMLRRLLESGGFEVLVAGSVAAARAVLALQPVDVLVSDIGLPDGSGRELMAHARRDYALGGIAVSGFGSEADVRSSLEAGFAIHFTKPLDVAQLFSAIRSLAEEKGGRATATSGVARPTQVS